MNKRALSIIFALVTIVTLSAHENKVCKQLDAMYDNSPALFQQLSLDNSGKAYYESLIDKASKRYWSVKTSFYFSGEDGAFDCDGCSNTLSSLIFKKDTVTIQDIYLFSKLSNDNKVRITNCVARAPERGGVPIGGTGVVFGGFRDDLYTTLLAPVKLVFDADQTEQCLNISAMRRFDVGHSAKGSLTLGFDVPLKSKKHSLMASYVGGELFRRGFVPDTTQRETAVKQFFRDFADVNDFITRAVLAPKELTLQASQRVSGLGDISVFASIDYETDYIVELGLSVVFPTSGKGKGRTVWEPIIGNGGSFQFSPFAQFLWYSSSPYLNPFARVAVEFSSKQNSDTTRVPTIVAQTELVRTMVKDVEGLSAPDTFENFYVDRFSEFDSCVALFAGKTPCISKKPGTKILFGFGNYAYKLFHADLRLGLLYDYYRKTKDSFEVNANNLDCDCVPDCIDEKTMEKCSNETAHNFGANLTYKFSNMFELGVGGQFTFLGRNVPKQRTFYISLVAVF